MQQEEIENSLKLTIAKLELKQLEFIDKLSEKHDDYVIRCITCPDTYNFLAVNGDWETVTGFNEDSCVGKCWTEFVRPDNVENIIDDSQALLSSHGEFDSFICDVIKEDGSLVSVDWRSKFFPEINATVSIGRVKK